MIELCIAAFFTATVAGTIAVVLAAVSDQVWMAWIGLAASVLGPIALAVAGYIKSQSLGQTLESHGKLLNTIEVNGNSNTKVMLDRIGVLEAVVAELKAEKKDMERANNP